MKTNQNLTSRLKLILPIALFCVFTTFLYGPLSLYLPNAQELWFGLETVIGIVLICSVVILAVLLALGVFLPEKGGKIYAMILFGVSLGLYLQGNFININYGSGVLDGSAIRWQDYTKYAVIDTAAWLICLALPFLINPFLIKIKKAEKISAQKIMAIASAFLLIIQIPALASQSISYKPSASGNLVITTDGMFELAEKDNTIIFILDTLDETYYEEFLADHPDYPNDLNGFVHYGNTVAAGAKTMLAVPAMFTGRPFLREQLYSEYLSDIWSKENALSAMSKAGVDVRVYSETEFFSKETADYVQNFKTGSLIGSHFTLAKKLYKLTLFKFAPHIFKKRFEMPTSEFNAAKGAGYISDDAGFFRSAFKSGFKINKNFSKTLRVYHLEGAHSPYKLGSRAQPKKDSTRAEQVEGLMFGVHKMMDDLKKQGLYDSANIIITADHGEQQKWQNIPFLFKAANATGEYRPSHAPVSGFDLPIYLVGLVNKKLPDQPYGCDFLSLKEDDERPREFFLNTSGSSRLLVEQFRILADAGDADKIIKVQSHEDPNGIDTPYQLGTELSFKTEATANRYTVKGFANNTGFSTKLYGPQAKLQIPITNVPDKGNLSCHIGCGGIQLPSVRTKIFVNGELVYRKKLTKNNQKNGIDFTFPVSLIEKGKPLNIDIRFPDIPKDEMKLSTKKRTYVIGFTSLLIKEN